MNNIYQQISTSISHIHIFIIALTFAIHLIFAAGIAKDAGNFNKQNITTQIVPSSAWVLATALGGVWVALIYWIIHHSSLSRR